MKRLSHVLLSFLLVVSPLLSLPATAQEPVKTSQLQLEQALEPAQLGEEAQQQIEAIMQEKRNRTPEQRKLDTQLWQTIKQRQGPAVESNVPRIKSMVEVDNDGKTLVELRLNTEASDEFLELLRNIDGEVMFTAEDRKLVRAELPIDLLEAVAYRTEIRSIRHPNRAKTNRSLPQQTNVADRAAQLRSQLSRVLPTFASATAADTPQAIVTGPPNTQGDAAHRAHHAREAYGVDGTGVKIGVLSDSVRFLDRSQASGNLPADVTVLPGQSGTNQTVLNSGEGTAMLEIIYDIAPGAKLFFATGTSLTEGAEGMARNIRDLRFKYGCDIIVDDIGYSGALAFQDDLLARAVNEVTKDGALYFSSAGNGGNYNDGTSGTWQGDFKDAGRFAIGATDPLYTFHDFGGGLISNRVTRTFGEGSGLVRLFWADPDGASENDYDIYLLDSTLRRVFNFSVDDQSITGFPGEAMAGFFEEGDRIVIANYNGAKPRALFLDTFNSLELALATGGAVIGHAAAADAFAVAAVPASAARNGIFTAGVTTPVEWFSSDGPRHIFFNADGSPVTPGRYTFADGGIVRQKPDLAAADGVSTSVTGFSTFFGTSAAAPHAAAIAALIKSAVPTITKEAMRELLTSTALDIGPAGWDRTSGAGVISTLNAYLKAKPSPFLEFASADVSWGAGDGDRSVEPGEEGLLQVAFVNTGSAMATGVTAKISTSTPGVTIVGSDSDYAP
ncbi:MAG TPA: S8 family serine peptidase, partial [Blastocatellia bacterium]|nr:S8 family serine peptidase [Blastocatellia bacterium]